MSLHDYKPSDDEIHTREVVEMEVGRAVAGLRSLLGSLCKKLEEGRLNWVMPAEVANWWNTNKPAAKPVEKVVRHTPRVWARMKGFEISDPDGWRSPNALSFKKPITEEEFSRRAGKSTVRFRKTK